MIKGTNEEYESIQSGRLAATAAYSASIQQAMRYDKLRSQDYSLVMSIMRAVAQGLTEESWETEQQKIVSSLHNQPPDQQSTHADAADRYEQMIARLDDLVLWPW